MMWKRRCVKSLFVFILVLCCAGCNLFLPTTLKITNNTSYELDLISWNGNFFGTDQVYDQVLSKYVKGMHPGSSDTVTVTAGSDHVYFWFTTPGPEYHTVDVVVVADHQQAVYTLMNSTPASGQIMQEGALVESTTPSAASPDKHKIVLH